MFKGIQTDFIVDVVNLWDPHPVQTTNIQDDSLEIDIMQEASKKNYINRLELIEIFEDDQAYYGVKKIMGAVNLFNYICQQPNQPLTESHTKKLLNKSLRESKPFTTSLSSTVTPRSKMS